MAGTEYYQLSVRDGGCKRLRSKTYNWKDNEQSLVVREKDLVRQIWRSKFIGRKLALETQSLTGARYDESEYSRLALTSTDMWYQGAIESNKQGAVQKTNSLVQR